MSRTSAEWWDEVKRVPGLLERWRDDRLAGGDARRLGRRGRVIASDPGAPADIRETFARILRDEEFHASAFAAMAGGRALEAARGCHEAGLAALGLAL
jgi:hypothetical protein